jgi:hypothetical protein
MEAEFILPLKGRYASGEYNQNFLWKFGSAYVMDNHRAALWCWLQQIDKDKKYSLLHIDFHYDCLSSRLREWLEALPQDIGSLTFDEYLQLRYVPADIGREVPIIRSDNYLSIFLKRYADRINNCIFATHGKGERPVWNNRTEIRDTELIGVVSNQISEGKWIVNVDLDYFFYTNHEDARICRRLYSDEYIDELFKEIARQCATNTIAVFTLSISPETCGGWEPAEKLAERICTILDLPFSLPSGTI